MTGTNNEITEHVPKKFKHSMHHIDMSLIDSDALKVILKLKNAGYTAYLVGGCIRDLLLNQKPKDFDISTSAKPEEVKKVFRNCILIGRRFRLAHLRFGKKILEVSTFRKGDNETKELILEDNVWGTPEEDVLRRDFTINGLFFDSESQVLIDYVNGFEDIQKKYLKTIGEPFVRFKQDPVRMIRLLKFEARFGFEVDDKARQALLECRSDIVKSSQARILEELFKMLESGASKNFIKLMSKYGLLEKLLPDVATFLEHKDGKEIYSFLEEIDMMIKEPHINKFSRALLLSCIFFPMLDTKLKLHIEKNEKSLHLGQIQREITLFIDQNFRPFFHLPKRIKSAMVTLLTTQYRLTPLEKKSPRRLRISYAPDFYLALEFLHIRTRLEPGLKTTYDDWMKVFNEKSSQNSKVNHKRYTSRPRKPRRRGP